MRKHLLEYDDIINAQREKIYNDRKKILFEEEDPEEFIRNQLGQFLEEPKETIDFVFKISDDKDPNEIFENHLKNLREDFEENFKKMLRISITRIFDFLWAEHITYLDDLKQTVSYRAYGQHDPLVEYKREALDGFDNFYKLLRFNLFQYLFNIQKQEKKEEKVGRNDPCPCGSGKKYKKCGFFETEEHKENMKKLK